MASNQILPSTPPSSLIVNNIICATPGTFSTTYSTNLIQSLNFNAAFFVMPFFVTTNLITTTINTYCVVGLAASTITMGIYKSLTVVDNSFPTGVAIAAGSAASTVQGAISVSMAVTLNQNTLYWAAIQLSSAITLSSQVGLQNLNAGNYSYVLAGTGLSPAVVSYTNTYSAGTLPTINQGNRVIVSNSYAPILYIT